VRIVLIVAVGAGASCRTEDLRPQSPRIAAGSKPATPKPQHVLLLHSFDASFDSFARNFRTTLAKQSTVPIDFLDVWLQPAGLSDDQHELLMVEDLQSKLAGHQLDLMVPLGGPAVIFAQKHRRELFPTTPMLLAGMDRRFVRDAGLTANDTAIPIRFDSSEAIEQILRLLPQTRHIFIAVGTAPLERFWRSELGRELQRFNGRLTFAWSDDLSFQDMLRRAATLPPNSAILYVMWSVDRDGAQMTQERVLTELHAAANAPIFGMFGSRLGMGIVGGLMGSATLLSRNTAAVAVRILGGESRLGVITQTLPSEYDWRELQRWNISESRLPPGSNVRFRELTLWDHYKWSILAVVTVSCAEALLIFGLFVNRAKRRRVESSLRETEERFRLVTNAAPVMIWASDVNKLCTYFNDSWLTFTGRSIDQELGNGWAEGVHREDIDGCLAIYTRAFDRRQRFRMEYRLRRSDGEFRWILDAGVPRFAPDGSFCGYIGSAVDVTDQKLAEAALSGLNRKLIRAQDEERALIARELHDDINQQLALLSMDLDLIQPDRRRSNVAALSRAVERAHSISKSVHQLSRRLHPAQLQLLGLIPAIENLRRDFSGSHQSIAFTHRDVPTDIDQEIALCVFRVVQEALGNAVKHGDAAHIWVDLTGAPAGVVLTVTDDGRGFEVGSTLGQGLGLTSMKERLESVGGVLAIQSTPGSGTRVTATVPIRAATAVSSEMLSA
jgi:PAS domain S-box-containing protein